MTFETVNKEIENQWRLSLLNDKVPDFFLMDNLTWEEFLTDHRGEKCDVRTLVLTFPFYEDVPVYHVPAPVRGDGSVKRFVKAIVV